MSDGPPPWKLLERTPLGDFKVFRLRKDTTLSPRTGQSHDFYILEGGDWVNVIALTEDGQAILVRQWRAGTERETLEIPGGAVDPGDASPLEAAKRELREETGYEAPRWTLLGVVDPNPAIQANACSTFLAEGCVKVGEVTPDAGEDIRVELHDPRTLGALVREGRIRHALVVAALYFWLVAARP